MRKRQRDILIDTALLDAKRLGYNPNTNITAYQYEWQGGHFEIIQVEGCKQIHPLEILRIRFKYDKSYIHYIKKILGVK